MSDYQQVREATEQGQRVLALIRKELAFDLDQLTDRRGRGADKTRVVTVTALKADFWKSVSASGDIKWIRDSALLDAISAAYYRINTTASLEARYVDTSFYPGITFQSGSSPPAPVVLSKELMDKIVSTDQATVDGIEVAISKIDAALSGNGAAR